MAVEIPLPRIAATEAHRTVTLGEVRQLVAAADALGLEDWVIVRGHMIPFHMPDLGHKIGGRIMELALDDQPEAGAPAAPNRSQRRAEDKARRRGFRPDRTGPGED